MAGCCGHGVWHNPSFVFCVFAFCKRKKSYPKLTTPY